MTPVGPANAPMLGDGGFENATLAPWVAFSNAALVSSQTHSGSRAVSLGSVRVEQTVTVRPNSWYVLSGWAKVDFASSTDEQVRIGVKIFNGANDQFVAINTPVYTQNSVTFQTGPSTTSVTVYCARTPYAVYGGYCDDLIVNPY